MSPVREDRFVLPIMDSLRACLATELESSPGGVPCVVALVPGQSVPADWCSCAKGAACGQAWVRLDRTYPTNQFPAQDTNASCKAGLAAVLEVGVIRCLPTTGANGAPPDAAAQTAATMVQLGDWQAMLRALQCCEALERRDTVLGIYTPRSQGGCGGGAWQVTVRLGGDPNR